MDFEIRLLRYALALAQHRNFARAARSLKITQPGLSRSIQSLERAAGVQIFIRGAGAIEVTDAGEVFLEYAREVMSHSSDLSREMELMKGLDRGELQIGVGTYVGVMYVDQAVANIVREHPGVCLRLASDNWANLLPLLRRRELDLAVIDARSLAADPEYHISPLTRRMGYLAVRPAHPLLKQRNALTMSDVLHYPFVSISRIPPALLRQFVSESAAGDNPSRPGLKTFPSIACESVIMMRNIVVKSDAVALLPLNILIPDLEAKAIAVLPLSLPWMQSDFGIVRLARRSLSPLGELFVRKMVEVDAEVAAVEEKAARRLIPRKKIARSSRA